MLQLQYTRVCQYVMPPISFSPLLFKKTQIQLHINTYKYHVFARMGRFQLELISKLVLTIT